MGCGRNFKKFEVTVFWQLRVNRVPFVSNTWTICTTFVYTINTESRREVQVVIGREQFTTGSHVCYQYHPSIDYELTYRVMVNH